uniref:Integrase catalytic domain-containing protein n=1 Tax=Lepisosteus oculatus TaxID=7918 RepID=W5NNL9_LEPOC
MRTDVTGYVQACPICAMSKCSRLKKPSLLQPLPTPRRPWSHISVDFLTDLPESQGKTTIMVVVDRFSKSAHFIPLPALPSAQDMADLFILHVFRLHSIPEDIVSDRGPQFISRFWRTFCKSLGTSTSLMSGYRPESNGLTERTNQDLLTYLRSYVSASQDDWVSLLPWAEYAHNSLSSSTTGMSPFYCSLGYQPSLLPDSIPDSDIPCLQTRLTFLRRIWRQARFALLKTSLRQKTTADRHRRPVPRLRRGQFVWLSARNLPLRQPSHKLGPRYIGPFCILSQLTPVTYRLALPPTLRVHSFHVSLLKPYHRFPLSRPRPPPPPPRLIDGLPSYTVNKILDARWLRGRLQFLVDWEGYGPEERSWVCEKDILDRSLIDDFIRTRSLGSSGADPKGGVLSCPTLSLANDFTFPEPLLPNLIPD